MITSVILPDSIKIIAKEAFLDCSNLEEIQLPHGLDDIDSYAFDGCGLRKKYIPDTVQSIDSSAFRDCIYLSEGRLPPTLKVLNKEVC